VSTFSAEWLALRERADAAARAEALLAPLLHAATGTRRIVDLATGTGANIRYLAPRLGGSQSWLAVDRDPRLLAAVERATWPPHVGVETRVLDLGAGLDAALLEGCRLVTASALLDLVAQVWIERLARATAEAGADALFALTYDGRIEWSPGDPDDALVRTLVNRHQRRDKGFGPALGPDAVALAAECFRAHGYETRLEPSDWRLGADAGALQDALIEGWRTAAAEVEPAAADALDAWAARRRGRLAAGASRLVVGHADLLAVLR
jgi:SAM-dependent methyltransferase